MEHLYEETPPNSPLRRFAAEWVVWKVTKNPHLLDSTWHHDLRTDRAMEIWGKNNS
jgi:hypothetical protein